VTVITTVPGQRSLAIFTTTTANQIVSLQVSGNTYPGSCSGGTLRLTGPSPATTAITSTSFCNSSSNVTLPSVGTYTLSVLPLSPSAGSLTIQLL
jgi:hypothetical protein